MYSIILFYKIQLSGEGWSTDYHLFYVAPPLSNRKLIFLIFKKLIFLKKIFSPTEHNPPNQTHPNSNLKQKYYFFAHIFVNYPTFLPSLKTLNLVITIQLFGKKMIVIYMLLQMMTFLALRRKYTMVYTNMEPGFSMLLPTMRFARLKLRTLAKAIIKIISFTNLTSSKKNQ